VHSAAIAICKENLAQECRVDVTHAVEIDDQVASGKTRYGESVAQRQDILPRPRAEEFQDLVVATLIVSDACLSQLRSRGAVDATIDDPGEDLTEKDRNQSCEIESVPRPERRFLLDAP